MTEVRWTTSDRGFRHYAEAEGHEVHESSAALEPHLWVDGQHVPLDGAARLRDGLPAGLWRDTLTVAIEQHYQVRKSRRKEWAAGDQCALCGSHDTWLVDDVAGCNGCGANEAKDTNQDHQEGR